MGILNRISRRAMLVGQAALAGVAAVPGMAATRNALTGGLETGPAVRTCGPARWHSATAEELHGHIGERFRVQTRDHGNLVLKLVSVESHNSGGARPDDLPRREGVTAYFESPDIAPLVAEGHGVHRVSHPRIGSADLYMSAMPRRYGGHYVEIVLN